MAGFFIMSCREPAGPVPLAAAGVPGLPAVAPAMSGGTPPPTLEGAGGGVTGRFARSRRSCEMVWRASFKSASSRATRGSGGGGVASTHASATMLASKEAARAMVRAFISVTRPGFYRSGGKRSSLKHAAAEIPSDKPPRLAASGVLVHTSGRPCLRPRNPPPAAASFMP
jgi:hypothetical protein